MNLLKFIICGNVDDGKSTLTGRLLYDTDNIFEDQFADHQDKETGTLDLARVTDGLKSERERGVTIDVAYKYFSTAKRKFICIDAPGHQEYTRNMISGASQADAAILLIDAKHGITDQTLRHAQICRFLEIRHIIVAINKMDAVDYLEEIYHSVSKAFAMQTGLEQNITYIPISGLTGDNVTKKTFKLDWHKGPTLLELLETIELKAPGLSGKVIVQHVIRHKNTQYIYCYYPGHIAGNLMHADSMNELNVNVENQNGMHYCLSYYGAVYVKEGDVLFATRQRAQKKFRLGVELFNLSDEPLKVNGRYIFLAQSKRQDITLVAEKHIEANSFGIAMLDLSSPSYFFSGETVRGILVDTDSFKTVAAVQSAHSAK